MHGVRTALTEAKVTVTGVPNHPGTTAALFKIVAELDINLGLVTQNPARAPAGRTDIAFTLAKPDGPATLATLRGARARIGFHDVVLDSRVAVITLTGAGMRSDPAIAATFCEALARTGIHLEIVSIESNRISVVCEETSLDTAVHALCEVFEVGVAHEPQVVAACSVADPQQRVGL